MRQAILTYFIRNNTLLYALDKSNTGGCKNRDDSCLLSDLNLSVGVVWGHKCRTACNTFLAVQKRKALRNKLIN